MEDDEVLGSFAAKKFGKEGHTPISVSVMLHQKNCKIQLDTGDTVSSLPKVLYAIRTSSSTSGPYVVPTLSWRLTIASDLMSMVKVIREYFSESRVDG